MRNKTLAGARIEQFLYGLVNLPKEDRGAATAFARRFEDMMDDLPSPAQLDWILKNPDQPSFPQRTLELMRFDVVDDAEVGKPSKPDKNAQLRRISYFQRHMESIWNAPGLDVRKYRILGLHLFLSATWDPTFMLHPSVSLRPPGPFALAILYILESADRLRICPNPDCPARYFFRKRKPQRYCSEKCAGVGQREAKLTWWRAKGEKWRKKRKTIPVKSKKKSQLKKGR